VLLFGALLRARPRCRGLHGGELVQHRLHLGLGLGGELLPDGAVLGLAAGALLGRLTGTGAGLGFFQGRGGGTEELLGFRAERLPSLQGGGVGVLGRARRLEGAGIEGRMQHVGAMEPDGQRPARLQSGQGFLVHALVVRGSPIAVRIWWNRSSFWARTAASNRKRRSRSAWLCSGARK